MILKVFFEWDKCGIDCFELIKISVWILVLSACDLFKLPNFFCVSFSHMQSWPISADIKRWNKELHVKNLA